MAIKFAGLYGKEVRIIGTNRETLKGQGKHIDRAFPRVPSSGVRCKASLQQLLNCLDGIDSQNVGWNAKNR